MMEGQEEIAETFEIASPAFAHGASIPSEYTCEGDRLKAPPIVLSAAPLGTQSVAIIMEDPDVPKELMPSGLFVHWVLFNIPMGPDMTLVLDDDKIGVAGVNTRGEATYTGPCPPNEYMPNEHRYFFYAYALNTVLPLEENASKDDVMRAMEGHVLARAELMGVYKKKSA